MKSPDCKIFLVEDDELYATRLQCLLQRHGEYDITIFGTAEEAVVRLYQEPDLIILDNSLPKASGITTLEHIRKFEPMMPVIMLSATEDVNHLVAANRLRARFLPKSLADPQAIYAMLDEVLSTSSRTRSVIEVDRNKAIRIGIAVGGALLLMALAANLISSEL